MSVRLYIAPAAAGKTAYVLDLARRRAQSLAALPRVIVASHLQARACRQRLAQHGGALGVRVLTFDQLYAECLAAAGAAIAELPDPVEYRLIRALLDQVPLTHYLPLRNRHGFVQVLQGLIAELKSAAISPADFAAAVSAMSGEPRLTELAAIYAAYQERMQTQGWTDRAGMGWLALATLRDDADCRTIACDWPLLAVDGFAEFTPVQSALLATLAGRVAETVVTLTGGSPGSLGQRRFEATRDQVEQALSVAAEPLPRRLPERHPWFEQLEAGLFRSLAATPGTGGAGDFTREPGGTDGSSAVARGPEGAPLELYEAADREGEVRCALRWLKARLVQDGLACHQVALLARSLTAYRPFIVQIATEFGLPLRLADGLPLRQNPATAALLDLLRLLLPAGEGGPALDRRLLIEAWRSPYFDWSMLDAEPDAEGQNAERESALAGSAREGDDGGAAGCGEHADHAEALDRAARWGQVLGGLSQWRSALASLADHTLGEDVDDERGLPAGLPLGAVAAGLAARFERFVAYLLPPAGARSTHDFACWLENLIGPDPEIEPAWDRPGAEPASLQMVQRARGGDGGDTWDRALATQAEMDVAALRSLKDVLRGLVWAEEAVADGRPVDYAGFFSDLAGSIEAAGYAPPIHPGRSEILAAAADAARGLPLRAVAVLGLAEGEFPAALDEDPFLREADRARLRDEHNLPLASCITSVEAELFYETVLRPAGRLLLTRPRLADNGAAWQASPFWEEISRLSGVQPVTLPANGLPATGQAASWPELWAALAARPAGEPLAAWAAAQQPEAYAAIAAARETLDVRSRRRSTQAVTPYPQGGANGLPAGELDGDLAALRGTLRGRFGQGHTWSASRLESYRTCPMTFFFGTALGLEPRSEPGEGLDGRQLGNIYHRILAQVYAASGVLDPADSRQVLAALPGVAERIFNEAPVREGFRVTGWWTQTRAEILANVRRSLEALAALPGAWTPAAFELTFAGELQVSAGGLRLHGVIDRIDRAPDGRIRIIDYKSAGPSAYTKKALAEGKKLQLPLYALAARDALELGRPGAGFYWHVRQAQASEGNLGDTASEVEEIVGRAVAYAQDVSRDVQAGRFAPEPPVDGCPSYCPAARFCWHYQPRFND